MKNKVEELHVSNVGLRTFPIGAGDDEGLIAEGAISVSNNCTTADILEFVGLAGVTSNSLFLKVLKTETSGSQLHISGKL